MSLNKSTGNMYPWVTHTWNPIQGRCPHACSYCYMIKTWNFQGSQEQVFKERYLKDDKGKDKIIFVGSSTDMWVGQPEWVKQVLLHCFDYPDNTYLFQSKDPAKMIDWTFPPKTILGTTIETDGMKVSSLAPSPSERTLALAYLKKRGYQTMVSIEPIMDFNLVRMVRMIYLIEPDFVSIGADSKKHNLPEPSKHEVELLIKELEKFTEVRLKDNLKRILCHERTSYNF